MRRRPDYAESAIFRPLGSWSRRGACFDLLFVDPPYRMLAEVEVLLAPLLPMLLSDDGVVVVEGQKSTNVALGQTPVFERVYGDTRVTMIRL